MNLKKESERVKKFAIEVLGDKESAKSWLNAPQIALGWKVPENLLNTIPGIHEVEDVLGRIEHGICL